MAEQLDNNPFIGTWQLVSFEMSTPGGTVSPFGRDPAGYFVFSPDGYASVNIMPAGRTKTASENPFFATDEEKIANAFFLSYAGRYEVKDDVLAVYPDVSYFPNWVGVPQIRNFRMEGDILVLSQRGDFIGTPELEVVLRWKRP
ncbi:MAG: lipocalin-like domain-containing protein [Bacillota bacterium]